MIHSEMLELLQSGVSIVVGTRNGSMIPETTRAVGLRIPADTSTLTIYLTEQPSVLTLKNLRENGRIAVSFSRPSDNRAGQVKGTIIGIRPTDASDGPYQEKWFEKFLRETINVGMPPEVMTAYIRYPAVAVEFRITEAFSQTPGPGAGARL